MISPEDDFIIDLSASCTKDQAVLRLMGWGVDAIYKKYIPVSHDGSLAIKSEKIYSSEITLNGVLSDIYREALKAYSDDVSSMEADEDIEEILELRYPKIEEAEALIDKARGYLLDIVDELSKGELSRLRLDKRCSEKNGEDFITIKSLDEWYGETHEKSREAVNGLINKNEIIHPKITEVSKGGKADNSLHITLALVAELYAKKSGTACWHNDSMNVKSVADAICTHGSKLVGKDQNLQDQGMESIRSRLTKANSLKDLLIRSLK